jgi:hypothetical protein
MPAEVILIYGSKSATIFKTSADALQEVLPRVMTPELSGSRSRLRTGLRPPDGVALILELWFRTPRPDSMVWETDSLIVVGQEDLRGLQGDNAAHACAPPGTVHGKHAAEHIETILKSE